VRRTVRLAIALCILAALTAPAALSAERMWIGFHDDPSFRWVADRHERVAGAAQVNASIVRLLVKNLVANTRPATSTDPFDPSYEFSDIDEAVLAAQENDLEVILTISGTPRWANGGKNPNVMPTRVAGFGNFACAIASRYSGRFEGYPFVRFWSVWNEPNLSSSSARSSTRGAAPSHPGTTRSSQQSRTGASRRETRWRRWVSAKRPLAAATRPMVCGRRTPRGSSPSSSRRPTRD
jgi:hypothetical protein